MGAVQSSCGVVTTEGRQLLRAVEDGAVPDVDSRLRANLGFVYWSTFSGGNTIWHKAAKSGQLMVLKSMASIVAAAYDARKDTEEGHQLAVLLRVGPTPRDALKRLVNLVNFKRCTPLMLAAARGHADVVEWLLDQGAMILVHDRIRHQTALHYAVECGHTDCVRLLLSAAAHAPAPSPGAEPGSPRRGVTERQLLLAAGNHAGLTALHYAVHEERYDAMKLLLGYGADINAQAEYPDLDWAVVNAGDTPMHIAAAKGSIEAIRILLKGFVESSGLLCPDHLPPRHARDPRGVRNDYGRLPYHLAMRKQFTWLAELLDPSVPVRYLLTGEEPDTATSFGPPRLAAIAAKVLHEKLMGELRDLKGGDTGAAAGCAGIAGGCAAAPLNSLQVALAAEREAASVSRPAGSARRRWSLTGLRRPEGFASAGSSGDAGITVGRLLGRSAEPAERHAAAIGAQLQTAAELRGSTPQGPRSRLMSPRASVGSIGPAPGDEGAGATAIATAVATTTGRNSCRRQSAPALLQPAAPVEPASTAAQGRRGGRSGGDDGVAADGASPASPLATAFAHVAIALGSPVLFDGKRKAGGASGAPTPRAAGFADSDECGSTASARSAHPEVEPDSGPSSSSGGSGDITCSGVPQAGEGCCDADKATPDPELLDEGHGPSMLDGLLRPFRLGACGRVAPAGHRGGCEGDDEVTCGVCLDAPPAVCILPCKHVMCVDCGLDMCKRYSLGTAACPFCRTLVSGFRAATPDEMRQH